MKNCLALAAAWLVGVGAVLVGGVLPDGYRQYVLGLPDPQPYPAGGVAMFAFVVTVETAILWAIVRPRSYDASWRRVLAALALFVPITLYFGVWLMHAPPYELMHFLWSACLCAALLVLCAISAVGAARRRRHGA
jgi:hypothetical protein